MKTLFFALAIIIPAGAGCAFAQEQEQKPSQPLQKHLIHFSSTVSGLPALRPVNWSVVGRQQVFRKKRWQWTELLPTGEYQITVNLNDKIKTTELTVTRPDRVVIDFD